MTQQWSTYYLEGKNLDEELYENYDPKFLTSKAYVFAGMIRNFEETKALFSQIEVEIEDKDIERFNAEIYFVEFQLFEALFAFLLAPFQPELHWVFLSQYSTQALKEKINVYLNNKVTALTGEKLQTQEEFLEQALFNEFRAGESKERWARNLENIRLIFGHLCRRYLAGGEYNAYKHGVRIILGPSYFSLSPTDEPDLVLEWESDNSVKFLEIDRKMGELRLVDKHFDPEQSIKHIQFMTAMLETIISTRLGKWQGQSQVNLMYIPDFDTENFTKDWVKDFNLRMKVGKKRAPNDTNNQNS